MYVQAVIIVTYLFQLSATRWLMPRLRFISWKLQSGRQIEWGVGGVSWFSIHFSVLCSYYVAVIPLDIFTPLLWGVRLLRLLPNQRPVRSVRLCFLSWMSCLRQAAEKTVRICGCSANISGMSSFLLHSFSPNSRELFWFGGVCWDWRGNRNLIFISEDHPFPPWRRHSQQLVITEQTGSHMPRWHRDTSAAWN